jgi:acetyl esterase/lipase
MRPSLQSQILSWISRLGKFKQKVEKQADKPIKRSKKGFVPKHIKRSYAWSLQTIDKMGIATFENKEKVREKHIIFFHGGGYIFEASPYHWQLAEKIVKKSYCRMTLIDYPLAPEHTYRQTHQAVDAAYALLSKQYPEDNFILMGDSAGGGLALAFAQQLIQDKNKKLPAGIVLLSPWLDLSMSNPDIKRLENRDHLMTLDFLLTAAKKYSHGDNPDQSLLSPINGNLTDLPKTLVFYGSEELFQPDCNRLKSLMEAGRQKHVFREYEKMQHDWALFPIPESKKVVDEICEFVY